MKKVVAIVEQKANKRKGLKNIARKLKIKEIKSNKNNTMIVAEKNAPVSKSFKMKQEKPKINQKSSTSVSHCEYVQRITTSGNGTNGINGLNIQRFHVNPGNKKLTPWLRSIAVGYENYKFKDLVVTYKPSCPATTTGTFYIVGIPDPTAPTPESAKDFMGIENATSNSVWTNLDYKPFTKTMNKEKSYYVENDEDEGFKRRDPLLVHCLELFIAYDGTPISTFIGEVFISYKVEFTVPRLNIGQNQIGNVDTATVANLGTIGTVNNNNPLGTLFTVAGNMIGNGIKGILNGVTGGTFGVILDWVQSITKAVEVVSVFTNTTSVGQLVQPLQLLVMEQNETDELLDSDYGDGFKEMSSEAVCIQASVAAVNGWAGWTNVSSTQVKQLTVLTGPYVTSGSSGYQRQLVKYAVKVKPGQVLQIVQPTSQTSGLSITGLTDFSIIDYKFDVSQYAETLNA